MRKKYCTPWLCLLLMLVFNNKGMAQELQELQKVPEGFGMLVETVSSIAPFLYISYLLFIGAWIGYVKLKKTDSLIQADKAVVYLMGAGLLVRLIIAPMTEGFSVDINLFRFWADAASRDFLGLYQGGFFLDYPPLYMYVLFIIGRIAAIFSLGAGHPLYILLLKLPAMLADIATAYLLYRLTRDRMPDKWRLFIAAIYLFNPAILINSTVWGQVDSILALFLLSGFMMLRSPKPQYAAVLFAGAVLLKPQGLIFMPVLLFELIKRKDIKLFIKSLLYGLGTALLIILPFAVRQGPLWIFELYLGTASGYKYVSLNAFNLFALLGANLKLDELPFMFLSYRIWGFIFIGLVTLYTAIVYWKGKGHNLPYIAAALLGMGVFITSIRMHERYLHPVLVLILAAFILLKDKRSLVIYAVASFTVFINTYVVLVRMMVENYPHVPPTDALLLFISLVNVAVFIYFIYWSWDSAVRGNVHEADIAAISQQKKTEANKKKERSLAQANRAAVHPPLSLARKDWLIMAAMTVIYLAIALVRLGDFAIPETGWRGSRTGEGFVLDLGSVQYVDRMTYFSGLGHGLYRAYYMDEEGVYQELGVVEAENNDVFKWNILYVSVSAQKFKVITVQPGGELKELALYGQGSGEPLKDITLLNLSGEPFTEGDILNLLDEQGIAQYRRSYMNSTYFDEIYHARTAFEHLESIRPYEWTHPPLGKIIISVGIALFGMNPFGWRIVGTLFGAFMIPLMYLFGKKLFHSRFIAFCTAFLMMFDLMHFAQTRIATIDVYTTFFVILMYYFMADYYLYKSYNRNFWPSLKPLLLSGLFFGLGVATKWSVLYGAPGLAFLFFAAKWQEYKDYKALSTESNKPAWIQKFWPFYINGTLLFCILFFIIIPGVIYFLSYIPYLRVPELGVSDIFSYQRNMYNYHSKLEATHSFSSEWWSWPLLIRPIWYYKGVSLPHNMGSTISSFGNPAIWWLGIVAMGIAIKEAWKGNKIMILVTVAIISQYLPWVLVPRIAFIYHFFPILPFVILAIVYCIKVLMERGKKKWVYGYLVLTGLLFVLFYPIVSGMMVHKGYIEAMRWLPTWFF